MPIAQRPPRKPRPPRSSARASRASSRRTRRGCAGFTLVELMVALVVGGLAVGSIYAVGRNSNHYFQQQYRVSNTMTALRLAMAQVKRDLQRAGYLATPNATVDSVCQQPPVPGFATNFAGVMSLTQAWGDSRIANGMDPGDHYGGLLPADTLFLLGNYYTASEYAGLSDENNDGATLELDQWWHAFRRDFMTWHQDTDDTLVDMARVRQVFEGAPVRIVTAGNRRSFFTTVTGVATPSPTGSPLRLTINPPVPSACRTDIVGGWIAPLRVIQYSVQPAIAAGTDNTISLYTESSERFPQLRRQELDISGAPLGTDAVVLEYVVTFQVQFLATVAGSNPEAINWTVNNLAVAGRPQDLRIARVTLRARSPGIDPTFPQATPPHSAPFERFIIDKDDQGLRRGAAHVRTLRADIFLPNMAL